MFGEIMIKIGIILSIPAFLTYMLFIEIERKDTEIKQKIEQIDFKIANEVGSDYVIKITESINSPVFMKFGGSNIVQISENRKSTNFILIDKNGQYFIYPIINGSLTNYYFCGYNFFVIDINQNEIKLRIIGKQEN